MAKSKKIQVAIFASGSGSNAENLYRFFQNHACIHIAKVFTNNKEAGVIKRFKDTSIPVEIFSSKEFKEEGFLQKMEGIDFIVLAGFLLLVPSYLIQNFSHRIVNIHPSLLPKYGGKGMYGSHVHEAVIAAGEELSGITIHEVNQEYDKGAILFQASCAIEKEETPLSLAQKIHQLEFENFPVVIEQTIKKLFEC